MCSSNTPRRQHRQCRATVPTPRPRRLMGLPPATLPIRSAPAPARDLPAGNGLGPHPLPPGTCRRETVTAYSPLGSTSLSPLVSYSTNSYSPARAPVRPRPRATRSQGEPRRRPSTHDAHRCAAGLRNSSSGVSGPAARGGAPCGLVMQQGPGEPRTVHPFRNFAGHGQHVFAAIKLKTHDPSTLLGCIPASQCTWYAPQS